VPPAGALSAPLVLTCINAHRTGRLLAGQFFESLGGSLVHSRTIHPDMAEAVAVEDEIRTFRVSTNTLSAAQKRSLLAFLDSL